MGSNSLTPRSFDLRQAARAREEEERRREQATSARNTSSTTVGAGGRLDIDGGDITVMNGGSGVVKDGGIWRIEDGGGQEMTGNGEMVIVGQGLDPFLGTPVASRMKFGNRIAHHTYTGADFLQPGIYMEGATPKSILETARLTGTIQGDGLISRSGRRQSEGQPTAIKEQSSSAMSPWSAALRTVRYDATINSDGEDGLIGLKRNVGVSTNPDAVIATYQSRETDHDITLSLSDGSNSNGVSKSGAVLSFNSRVVDPSSSWVCLDKGGLLDFGAKIGAKAVAIDSKVAGKLQLTATDGVDIAGAFTVNGAPVGGAVKSVNTKTGDVVLGKADVGLGNVDNTSDANKPVSTPTATALAGKAATVHTHTIAQVTGLQDALDSKVSTGVRHAEFTATGPLPSSDAMAPIGVTLTPDVGQTTGNDFATIGAASQVNLTPGVYTIFFMGDAGASMGTFPMAGLVNVATGVSYIQSPYPSGEWRASAQRTIYLPSGGAVRFEIRQNSGAVRTFAHRVVIDKWK
ncbi:hypothetical protein [Arthrobacter sp. GMC3]|uniref:hypothetical protein n=1 Tax=Arthrobacter sp. GMC3 TaxID=2058894 RepID=UPI000CE31E6F|nr:hypothetical protein [Arthrobacter sp. GMC3]